MCYKASFLAKESYLTRFIFILSHIKAFLECLVLTVVVLVVQFYSSDLNYITKSFKLINVNNNRHFFANKLLFRRFYNFFLDAYKVGGNCYKTSYL